MACVFGACAADPRPDAEGGAAADAGGEIVLSDARTFESDVNITCVAVLPRAIPLGASCLFALSPPLPVDGQIFTVTADGVALPADEFNVMGRDVLELTGPACVDYLAGRISTVAVHLACEV